MAAIKDVARYAGLSVSVVSKYLKNPDSVRPDTRERVEAAIKELHFQPNLAARALRTKRTNMIVVVTPQLRSGVFNELLYSLQYLALQSGYHIAITSGEYLWTTLDSMVHNYSPLMLADGIIFYMDTDKSVARTYSQIMQNKPQISISRYPFLPGVPNVTWDNDAAIYLTTKHLIDLGHKEIALMSVAPRDEFPNNRYYGYLRAMSDSGLRLRPSFHYCYDNPLSNVRGGYMGMEYFMNLPVRPTAIVTETDFFAIGCTKYADEHGISIPEDVALTGLHDSAPAAIATPPITSVPFPADAIASKALEMLFSMFHAPPEKRPELPENTVLPVELVVRRSSDPSQPKFLFPAARHSFIPAAYDSFDDDK